MAVNVKNVNAAPTERQLALVHKLADELHGENAAEYLESVAHLLETRYDTSELIDGLMAASKARRADAIAKRPAVNLDAVKPGFYAIGDDVFRVKPGKRYAEKMVPGVKGTWDYARGAIYRVAELEPMTKEQAAEMGRRMGVCVRCGAYLEADGPWREFGLGPVCVKKAW